MTNFHPKDIITNDDLKTIINEIIENFEIKIKECEEKMKEYNNNNEYIAESQVKYKYKYDLFIKEILSLIPEVGNNEKQRDIKMLYETLWIKIQYKQKEKNNQQNELEEEILKEKEEKLIKLDSSFWEKINEKALEKCLKFFEYYNNLKYIDLNEENAISNLEVLYKYIEPQTEKNKELKIVPNQNGYFCRFIDLYNENDINQNFKKMLKDIFNYDLSNLLIHQKLKGLTVHKNLTIDDKITLKIQNSFYKKLNEEEPEKKDEDEDEDEDEKKKDKKKIYYEQYSKHIKKAKELIHFYPKNEGKEEDNLVKKFIKCYKLISKETFEEEEINTFNSNLWDKAIKILLIDILRLINKDKNFSETFKRLNMIEKDEDELINNLNDFYDILFKYLLGDNEIKIIDDFEFVPNERKEYKKLNYVFINKDIDEEIKEIYSYLDKDNYFKKVLIPKKINLHRAHQEKTLKDITLKIDREIKRIFLKIDNFLEIRTKEVKIEENFKIACTKLIREWFANHMEERKEFEFVNSHIPDIASKIIYEGKYKDIMDKLYILNSPENFCTFLNNYISNNNNINKNNIQKNNIQNNNIPNNNIQNSNSRSHYRGNNRSYHKNYRSYNSPHYVSSYSYQDDISFDFDDNDIEFLNSSNSTRNISFFNKTDNNIFNNNNVHTIPENLKKYFLAQAYVFEDLNNSKLFNQIDWKNRVNNKEEGEEITLLNNNKYKIKNSDNLFDFTITSNNNKSTNIIVQVLNEKRYNYIKLKCTVNQWNLFNNEGNEHNTSIFSLVRFNLNNAPEILFIKKSNLNEII